MSCLSDVLAFFIQQAGPGTSAMRTNDLRKMGLTMSSQGHRTQGHGHRGRHHHDDDSGFDDPLGELHFHGYLVFLWKLTFIAIYWRTLQS